MFSRHGKFQISCFRGAAKTGNQQFFISLVWIRDVVQSFLVCYLNGELGISTRQASRDKNSALAKMLKRMKAAGYESYAEAAGAFLQESDYIPTQMETQNSIMKKRTGEVRLPSDHNGNK